MPMTFKRYSVGDGGEWNGCECDVWKRERVAALVTVAAQQFTATRGHCIDFVTIIFNRISGACV